MAKKKLTEPGIKRLKDAPPGKRDHHADVEQGLVLRVTDTGAKTWCLLYYPEGKQRRHTFGQWPEIGVAKAREMAREAKQAVRQGLAPDHYQREQAQAQRRQRANTFTAIATLYMEEHGNRLKTHAEYQRKLDVDLLPTFGDRPITEITRAEIRQFLVTKAKRSPISANRLHALISVVFNYAMDQELITASPIHRMKKPGQENERERVLTDTELRSVWFGAQLMGYPFGTLVRFLILTAQRRGEAAGLTWQEIDGTDWRLPKERAKGGTGHIVPLAPLALDLLGEARKGQVALGNNKIWNHVFSSGPADLTISGWRRYRRRLEQAMPEPVTNFTLHDLRRTAATGMRTLGVDRLTVSKVLNHAESGITRVYDRYAADPEKKRAMALWSEHVSRIVRGEPTPENVVEMPLKR